MDTNQFKGKNKVLVKAYYAKPYGMPISGIPIIHPTEKCIEDYVMGFYSSKKLNEYVFAWKAGTLVKDKEGFKPREKNGEYLNGYGSTINKKNLCEYLECVSNEVFIGDDFEKIYRRLIELHPPKNFGAVYIINLLFFKSGGKWPIYDKFTHKAAKALFMKKHPSQIYVGDAPNKRNIRDVVNMYSEYIWLLEKLFSSKSIDRKTDRALWVYGHATD